MGLFDGQNPSQTTTNKLPPWMNKAGKFNYMAALGLASRPYVPYSGQRIAGFTGDQKWVQDYLRNWKPRSMTDGEFKMPRLIDNIPGMSGGPSGSVEDYMNPYIDQVLDRTENRIGRATAIARQRSSNAAAHGAGAFGDARHGIADAEIERAGIDRMGDAAAEGYAGAYNNAMGLRQFDINNLFRKRDVDRQGDDDIYRYLAALDASGGAQQQQGQKNLDLGYSDFLKQMRYPYEQLNLLMSALNGTPRNTTSYTEQDDGDSSWLAKLLGGIGSIGSIFL